MKKMIFLAAIAASVMTSCTNSEMIDISEGRAISFQNAVLTRAAQQLENGKFNIIAYKGVAGNLGTSNQEINGVYILDDGAGVTDKYEGTPNMYYYDGVNSYWFYGYAATNATTAAANAATTFTKDPTGATPSGSKTTLNLGFEATTGKVDLVTMATGEVITTAQNPQKTITFKHALARIRFSARTQTYDPTNTPIQITKITLRVGKDKGNVTETSFANGIMTADASGSPTSYVLSSGFRTMLRDATTMGSAYESATTNDDVFFIVPQNINLPNALEVEYTVDGIQAPNKIFDFSGLPAFASIPTVSGFSYNFAITINLNEITFNAYLEDWDMTNDTTPIEIK